MIPLANQARLARARASHPLMHLQDQDCTRLDADGACLDCGVSGGYKCEECGGERFHTPACSEFVTT